MSSSETSGCALKRVKETPCSLIYLTKPSSKGCSSSPKRPWSAAELAKICEISEPDVREVLALLSEDYSREDRGIVLREVGGGWQFATAPAVAPYIEKTLSEKKTKLSHAAYETLAIIAYKQPVTRSQIEYIRGVKSDGPIQQLLARGLIEEQGRLDQPGRPSSLARRWHFSWHLA